MIGLVISSDVGDNPFLDEHDALNIELQDAFELYKSLGYIVGSEVIMQQLELNTRLSKFLVQAQSMFQISMCQCGGIIDLSDYQQLKSGLCFPCLTDATTVSQPAKNREITD